MSTATVTPPIHSVLGDDTPRVRRGDSVSSHEAADSISKDGRKDSQDHVLLDLRTYGRSAAWQIEERAELLASRWSPSRLRTALKEVEESGLVVRHHLTGLTPRGRRCDEFEAITDKGRAAVSS